MLEECGLPYVLHPVNIGAGDQFDPAFLIISPNNKIPAITDPDGPDGQPISLFESGAILFYLASKAGKFLPRAERDRFNVLQWLMFQVGGVGPMLGQAHHFRLYAVEKIPYAIERYSNEAQRLYGVIERQLCSSRFIAGNEYAIADMAIFPWIRSWEKQGIVLSDFPSLQAWFETISVRPAVHKALQLMTGLRPTTHDPKARETLFGNSQYMKR